MYISGRYLTFIGLGRIVIGIIFLWAGLEKVLGSGPDSGPSGGASLQASR